MTISSCPRTAVDEQAWAPILAPAGGPLPERIAAELARCAEAVDSGRAGRVLEDWVAATGRCRSAVPL